MTTVTHYRIRLSIHVSPYGPMNPHRKILSEESAALPPVER